MRNLRFQEVLLLSRRERAARSVILDQDVTIVLGKNDTGKSALLKSIYASFGATAAVVHPRWDSAAVISFVKFTVDDIPFSILRAGSFYALFDASENLIFCGDRVLNGLGPILADLLSYKIVLTSSSNEPVPPPPQYFFLPFYVDQDEGWRENWSSFAHLRQVREWRKNMVEFHTGIRPNEYYTAKSALVQTQSRLREARAEVAVVERMVAEVRNDAAPTFDIDLDSFQQQVKALLDECGRLKSIEEQLSSKLNELYARRHTLQTQIDVAAASLKEVAGDYRFATERITHSEVECPTCGALYSNSFAERFAIAQDEDRLTELIIQLKQELSPIGEEIQKLSAQHSNQRAEIQRINGLLDQRQGEVTMRAVIQSEGRKEINQLLAGRVDDARERVTAAAATVESRKADLKSYEDPDRTERILDRYHGLMKSYLNELRVFTLPERAYEQVWSNISETGSDLPRALLAYYFAILTLIQEFSTSTICPIVIDSPNQQGQDQESIRTMLQFIRDHRPKGAQMILAIEDRSGVSFGGSVLELSDRYHLLRTSEYDTVDAVVTPLLSRALSQQS
jgi:hypothetical protein